MVILGFPGISGVPCRRSTRKYIRPIVRLTIFILIMITNKIPKTFSSLDDRPHSPSDDIPSTETQPERPRTEALGRKKASNFKSTSRSLPANPPPSPKTPTEEVSHQRQSASTLTCHTPHSPPPSPPATPSGHQHKSAFEFSEIVMKSKRISTSVHGEAQAQGSQCVLPVYCSQLK